MYQGSPVKLFSYAIERTLPGGLPKQLINLVDAYRDLRNTLNKKLQITYNEHIDSLEDMVKREARTFYADSINK